MDGSKLEIAGGDSRETLIHCSATYSLAKLEAWPDPVNLLSEKSWICGFCGEPLQFLLQVYTSIYGNESTFHRTLYVFMRPSMTCLLRDQHEQWRYKQGTPFRSVNVFRCQLPRFNPYYSSVAPNLTALTGL